VTAGVVLAALITATAVSIWQASRATAAQREAEADRDRAKIAEGIAETNLERAREAEQRAATEAAIGHALQEYHQDLLRLVDGDPKLPDEVRGKANQTVWEALDLAAATITERFGDQPLTEAAIRMAISDGYWSLDEAQLSIPHQQRAVALRQAHLGPVHLDTHYSMEGLAGAYYQTARYAEGIALRKQVLASYMATLGPDHPKTLRCVHGLAAAYHCDWQFEITVQLLEDLLEKQRRICGPVHEDTLNTMTRLAMAYADVGWFAQSITLYESYIDGIKSAKAPNPEPVNWQMMAFAKVCQRAGELDRAERLLRDVLEQVRKRGTKRGTPRPLQPGRANALGWLALNMLYQERYTEAEPLVREALAYFEKEFPNQPRRFFWMSLLGAVLLGQQNHAEAETLILQGYEGLKQRLATRSFAKHELDEAGQRVVRYYEETNQPGKARQWRERLLEDQSKK
jgi:non-specific serine/threonine protein kinase/serine/threonine-protein kinase